MAKKNAKKVSSPLDEYYLGINEKVDQLILEDKYQDALELLVDELEAPYIPLKYANLFEDKSNSVKAELYFSKLKPYEKLDIDQLFSFVLHQSRVNYNALNLLFEKYSDAITTHHLDVFNDFLSAKTTNIKDKHSILLYLKLLNRQMQIDFYNPFLKKLFALSISQVKLLDQVDLYNKTDKIISELTIKEASLYEIAKPILKLVYMYYFPKEIKMDARELAYCIFEYIMFCFDNSVKIQNQKHFNLIHTIISAFDLNNE